MFHGKANTYWHNWLNPCDQLEQALSLLSTAVFLAAKAWEQSNMMSGVSHIRARVPSELLLSSVCKAGIQTTIPVRGKSAGKKQAPPLAGLPFSCGSLLWGGIYREIA